MQRLSALQAVISHELLGGESESEEFANQVGDGSGHSLKIENATVVPAPGVM